MGFSGSNFPLNQSIENRCSIGGVSPQKYDPTAELIRRWPDFSLYALLLYLCKCTWIRTWLFCSKLSTIIYHFYLIHHKYIHHHSPSFTIIHHHSPYNSSSVMYHIYKWVISPIPQDVEKKSPGWWITGGKWIPVKMMWLAVDLPSGKRG